MVLIGNLKIQANELMGLIRKMITHIDKCNFNLLCKSFITSHLEYSKVVLSHIYKKGITLLGKPKLPTLVYHCFKLIFSSTI